MVQAFFMFWWKDDIVNGFCYSADFWLTCEKVGKFCHFE